MNKEEVIRGRETEGDDAKSAAATACETLRDT